jgi:hypothetical protein
LPRERGLACLGAVPASGLVHALRLRPIAVRIIAAAVQGVATDAHRATKPTSGCATLCRWLRTVARDRANVLRSRTTDEAREARLPDRASILARLVTRLAHRIAGAAASVAKLAHRDAFHVLRCVELAFRVVGLVLGMTNLVRRFASSVRRAAKLAV